MWSNFHRNEHSSCQDQTLKRKAGGHRESVLYPQPTGPIFFGQPTGQLYLRDDYVNRLRAMGV